MKWMMMAVSVLGVLATITVLFDAVRRRCRLVGNGIKRYIALWAVLREVLRIIKHGVLVYAVGTWLFNWPSVPEMSRMEFRNYSMMVVVALMGLTSVMERWFTYRVENRIVFEAWDGHDRRHEAREGLREREQGALRASKLKDEP